MVEWPTWAQTGTGAHGREQNGGFRYPHNESGHSVRLALGQSGFHHPKVFTKRVDHPLPRNSLEREMGSLPGAKAARDAGVRPRMLRVELGNHTLRRRGQRRGALRLILLRRNYPSIDGEELVTSGPGRVERRLAAIFAADVAGYSRLMNTDEVGTLRNLTLHREVMDRLISEHGGRIANTAGDSVLAEFPSAVDAVQCAVEVQRRLTDLRHSEVLEHALRFRIGIHVGDVMVRGTDLLGDGVNVAARLEGIAEPGGVCISGAAYEQVRQALPISFKELGPKKLKNIDRPVQAYAVPVGGLHSVRVGAADPGTHEQKRARRAPLYAGVAVSLLVLACASGAAWWMVAQESTEPQQASGSNPAQSDKPSVAVLPFLNLSDDKAQEYFSDGITDDVINDLSKIAGLLVVARNSTFTFRKHGC